MLYSSKGVAISSYTGSDGCDRRDIVYLGNFLPKIKDDTPVERNCGKKPGKLREDEISSSDDSSEDCEVAIAMPYPLTAT